MHASKVSCAWTQAGLGVLSMVQAVPFHALACGAEVLGIGEETRWPCFRLGRGGPACLTVTAAAFLVGGIRSGGA